MTIFSYARSLAVLGATAAIAVGCVPAAPPPAGAPVPDADATAAQVARASVPTSPRQSNFRWELNEAGSRLSGQGVARYAAPERVRLDLFGPRGETYLAAALVGDDFRVPPEVAERFALPSPALLWASIGVVRPPAGATLQAVNAEGAGLVLRYALPEGRVLEYRVDGNAEAPRVRRVEVRGPRGVLETLELTWGTGATPEQSRYRDVAAFRELTLRIERTTDVAPFPEATWRPTAP